MDGYASNYNVLAGQSVTVYRVTVENCSEDAQTGVRLRLYLSTNRSLTSSDHLVGNYSLGTISPVTRIIDSYDLDTEGIPPGTYYVGMKVSRGGTAYNDDDRPANDVTWSTYQITITGTVGVAEITQTGELGAFPNPTTGVVHVTMPNGVGSGRLEVFDTAGRSVRDLEVRGGERMQVPVDLSPVTPGLYLLRLSTADGRYYSARVMKQ